MGRKRKRKLVQRIAPPPMQSQRRARKICSAFHRLKQIEEERREREEDVQPEEEEGRGQRRDQSVKEEAGEEAERERLTKYLEAEGGVELAYSKASELTTTQHSTSKKIMRFLSSYGAHLRLSGVSSSSTSPSSSVSSAPPGRPRLLRVLEIGAVNCQLLDCPWLEVTAIDICVLNPRIQQQDIFDLPGRQEYDVCVCSMVINSIGAPSQRGELLRQCRAHLKDGGLLFLNLPSRCAASSTFFTQQQFENDLLAYLGFSLVSSSVTKKIVYYVLRVEARKERPHLRLARCTPERAMQELLDSKSMITTGRDQVNADGEEGPQQEEQGEQQEQAQEREEEEEEEQENDDNTAALAWFADLRHRPIRRGKHFTDFRIHVRDVVS